MQRGAEKVPPPQEKTMKSMQWYVVEKRQMVAVFLFLIVAAVYGVGQPANGEQMQHFSNKVQVGAYYYPWYHAASDERKGQWSHVMRLHLNPPQRPRCGLYDSADPNVIRDHIAQSMQAGLDFWAVSWWGPQSLTDNVFKDAVLKHPEAGKLKYAVLYESTGRLGSFSKPSYRNWISDLKYIKETYFNNPCYLTIDGRPVVFFYLSREYFRNKGQEALAQMRKEIPELYLIGDDVFFAGGASEEYKPEWAANFDAVTVYDVYGQSIGRYGNTQKAVEILAANYRQAKQAANSVGVGFVPTIAPGYNDTAVRKGHPGRARYFADADDCKEGEVFRQMIRKAALPNADVRCGRIIMITSFNEWFEDSQIEATAGIQPETAADDSPDGKTYTGGSVYRDYGTLYLDILREEIK